MNSDMLVAERDDEYIVIEDVSWEAYEQILDALGECHMRHTYDRGRLELRSVLYGVPWESYEGFLAALPEHYLRHTYDRGTLEMMSPSYNHENKKKLVGRMLEAMCLDLDLEIVGAGSTTYARAVGERGLQPDESYYVVRAKRMFGRRKFDPARDPPPDLVLEVEETRHCLARMPVFAALRVPEIWRLVKGQIEFHLLGKTGRYRKSDRSRAFPFLRPDDLNRFLADADIENQNTLIRGFVAWARQRYEAAQKKSHPRPKRRPKE